MQTVEIGMPQLEPVFDSLILNPNGMRPCFEITATPQGPPFFFPRSPRPIYASLMSRQTPLRSLFTGRDSAKKKEKEKVEVASSRGNDDLV